MEKKLRVLAISIIVVMLSVLPGTNLATAGVMWTDDAVFGPGTIIRDLDNDKDFLQLDFTTTWSYYDIVNEFGTGGAFEGWQVASEVDLEALATAAGIVDGSHDSAIISIAKQLMFWFCDECIRTSTTHKYARGLMSDTLMTNSGWLAQKAFSIDVAFGADGIYGTSDDYAMAAYSGWGPILIDEATWLVRDAPSNLPPVFDPPIGSEIVDELDELTIGVNATDPDNDVLTYSATDLPPGASFTAQKFSWTPNGSQAGTYFVTFIVNDGHNPDVSEKVEITVFDNPTGQPPLKKKKKKKAVRMELVKVTKEVIGEVLVRRTKLIASKTELEEDYDVDVTFDNLEPRNADTTVVTYDGCGGDETLQVGGYCLGVTTDATSYDSVEICVQFDEGMVNPAKLTLMHYECDNTGACAWVDRTAYISPPNGNVTICGTFTELSPFFVATNSPPVVGQIEAPSEPQPVGTPVNISAEFTDADQGDTHMAQCSWGDGVVDTISPATSPISASHAYSTAGVYTINLTVTDASDDEGTSQYQYVVVYDPSAGFVTGGGWIESLPEAYVPDPTLGGKANFGFVSKYKKGADIPTGNTEFQFRVADLNFHSDTYEWLVITMNGTNAQFKGSGTINSDLSPTEEPYKFMLWARDLDPYSEDTFRIKIWYEDGAEEIVVYDNGFDQPIGGGSIVVHTKK